MADDRRPPEFTDQEPLPSGLIPAERLALTVARGHAVLLPDGRTVGEWIGPQLGAVYAQGQMPALMPGSADA